MSQRTACDIRILKVQDSLKTDHAVFRRKALGHLAQHSKSHEAFGLEVGLVLVHFQSCKYVAQCQLR